MIEPLTHALIFILVLRQVRKYNPKLSDLTLGNEDPDSLGLDG